MKIQSALYTSFERVFPTSRLKECDHLQFRIARNQRFSFQIACRLESVPADGETLPEAHVCFSGDQEWRTRIRCIGTVPVRHRNTGIPERAGEASSFVPGFVPDPLFECDRVTLRPLESMSFWIGVRPEGNPEAGMYRLDFVLEVAGRQRKFSIEVDVCPVEIRPRCDFFVTNWFYCDALMDWYRTDYRDERFWEILGRYLENLAEHFQDTLYVPLFTPPLDGEKRNCQLLLVHREHGSYRFDWSRVERYVKLALRCGISRFEWCHLFSQWGARYAAIVYDSEGKALWERQTPGEDQLYLDFLERMLPELHDFCKRIGILEQSIFHLSDEPREPEDIRRYCRVREQIRRIAPWIRIAEAFSESLAMPDGVIDLPIPNIAVAGQFLTEKRQCAVYFCCGPRGTYLQRLLDTPLGNTAMAGFLFFRFQVKGFLHWGGNYWYQAHSQSLIDPFMTSDGNAPPELNWAHGDPFLIYPGADGPLDSIRHEVMAEALQDYALLQTLNLAPDAPELKRIRAFDDFPCSPDEVMQLRKEVLACR